MTAYRILHVDDDPLMRDVVELALGLEPNFALLSCESGEEALKAAPDWEPALILCDVMMDGMDGPALFAKLRADPRTAKMPLVFMTARPQPDEIAHLKSLGALGVIQKPFKPETLADTVRGYLKFARTAAAGYDFAERLRNDAATLEFFRTYLRDQQSEVPDGLLSCAHKLAGAAGVFEFEAVSSSASALEDAIKDRRAGKGAPGKVESSLDALLECIGRQ